MSTKEVVYGGGGGDKQELHKQLGCMNVIFHLFDRRYLVGQRRHTHKRLTSGQSDNDQKEFSNETEQAKEKNLKEKHRVSVESARNSFSSTSSSTFLSSLDCSKRVQTEQSSSSCQSLISEPSSSLSLYHRKQPDFSIQSPDIRDVVKDSMTREPRVVSIKTAAKQERAGPAMKHIDSPRPFPHQNPVQYDGNDQWKRSRFSCDGRETRYSMKSNNNMKVKELPRLSLDSKRGRIGNSENEPIRSLLIRENQEGRFDTNTPKRPSSSSSVVARLMGLEALTATSIDETETFKTKPSSLVEEPITNPRSSRKREESKQNRVSNSISPRVANVITRIPLETAPWKQEGNARNSQKPPPFKSKEAPQKQETASPSIYGEIEKRLTEQGFKTTGKDLRALQQILEAMQKTRKRLENQKIDNQPVAPTITSPRKLEFNSKPGKIASNPMMITDIHKVKNTKDSVSRKAAVKVKPLSIASPRTQRSKNGIEKPSLHMSSPDSIRTKKQRIPTRNPNPKSMDPRNLIQQSDAVSYPSDSNSLASLNDSEIMAAEWSQEVNSAFRPKENHRGNEEKSTADHAKHTMEQPSPVSVLDAFYSEETPSPVKKKSNAFKDDEIFEDQTKIDDMANSKTLDQYSEFNTVKLEQISNLVHKIELLNINSEAASVDQSATFPCESEIGDQDYIKEILFASGFLKDLNFATTMIQFPPKGNLINHELFHVLEKTEKKNTRSKIRRKLVFDTVNDVLGHKLSMIGPFQPRTKKNNGKILNGEKLLKELWSEIDSLENNSERFTYDEDDEVINIINADVNKRSQDWDEHSYEVPSLVLDIERLIFKDLISEVVNAQVISQQDLPAKHCRQLFPV